MVAYSFQRRFVDPIQAGTKTQTIRGVGKRRHARVGAALQLYFAMRTKHCRKIIADPLCRAVYPVRLILWKDEVSEIKPTGADRLTEAAQLDAFAVRDGFGDWSDMRGFWRVFHPGVTLFDGVLVGWP